MPKITRLEPANPILPSVKRVAAYARVSDGKDAMLHSLSAQVSYFSELIQRHREWEFAGVYVDEALTGTKADRSEFQRLIADCRAGQIDMVITKSISRFARNTVTMLEAVRELKSLGVDVFFEKEDIHSISGDGELMLTILTSFAQEESRSVSENCKWRIRKRFEEGDAINLYALFGYRIKDKIFHVVPEEAATVRFIFECYLDGLGVNAIIKQLEPLGVRLSRNGIAGILRNEKYVGDLLLQKTFRDNHLTKRKTPNRGELPKYYISDHHEGIIPREQFEAVQTEISRRAAKHQPNPLKGSIRYPFTGLIRCGICGNYYHRKIASTGKAYRRPVWMCKTYDLHGKASCASQQIPEKVLMEQIVQVLGLSEFDEREFKKQISEIIVPGHHRLAFCFKDGRRVECEWHTSRRDSWTSEKREAARQLALSRRRKTE